MNKKICIVYTHHKLGDLIWQLPYIKAISDHFNLSVDLILREKTQGKKILRDENNTRYLNRVEYPVIPIQDSDTFIRGQFGKTFSNLAFEVYGKIELWWIIARANNENRGSMYVVPGKEYRIPQNITNILQEFKKINK